jgi:hypothetical protein
VPGANGGGQLVKVRAAAARLLRAVRDTGAADAVAVLAHRAACDPRLDGPSGVAGLLAALSAAGAGDAVAALLTRNPAAHASLHHPSGVARLIEALREAGAVQAIAGLAAAHGVRLQADTRRAQLYTFGREPYGTPSRSWKWLAPADRASSDRKGRKRA